MNARKPIIKCSKTVVAPSGGFIALGNRPGTPETTSIGGTKREASSSGGGLPLKKPRLMRDGDSTKIQTSTSVSSKKEITNDSLWQNLAVDVLPLNVIDLLDAAETKGKNEKIERLMCGLIKLLSENRAVMPDPMLTAVLCYLAREKSKYFHFDSVVEGFCSLLRKQSIAKPGAQKSLKVLYPLVTNLLCATFEEKSTWPELFVKVYLDDAVGDRVWIDRRECAKFVEIIENAFGTFRPAPDILASLFMSESRASDLFSSPQRGAQSPFDDHGSGGSSSREANLDEPFENIEGTLIEDEDVVDKSAPQSKPVAVGVQRKFINNAELIRQYTVELLRDIWSRRQDTVPKGLLKTMSTCCGYPEVRLAASQKLDNWLQNAKFQRVSVELMLSMCLNCKEQNAADVEVIQNLVKLRLKTKPIFNSFSIVLKELFNQNIQYLGLILKFMVHYELSTTKAPHNMFIIGECFRYNQQMSCHILAEICFEFLTSKEDYGRALRVLLKEIVRNALKFDFTFVHFCESLLSDRGEFVNLVNRLDSTSKERLFHNIEDLFVLAVFLGISPSVKEAAIGAARGDRRDILTVRVYQQHVIAAQKCAINWLQNFVPLVFKPSKEDYIKCFFRILFLDKTDFYSSKDNWPSENERNLFLKIITEAGVSEEILINVLTIGLSPTFLLSPTATIDIIETLIRKAAVASVDGKFQPDGSVLSVSKLELIDLLLHLCEYRIPDSISLPSDYSSPLFSIGSLFWRTSVILIILACHNPTIFGRCIWLEYPTLCLLMHMLITDDFTFPPASAATDFLSCDDIKRRDLQLTELERQQILEFETYLAAATTKQMITESNSLLLSQLIRRDTKDPARRPPTTVLEQLKAYNQQLNLGLLLCQSRDPDFLLEIINKQGATHSLPWLIQLIQKNEGSISMLPVQCLCEFLLNQLEARSFDEYYAESEEAANSANLFTEQRMSELKQRLITVFWNSSVDVVQFEQALMYFINRLQASTLEERCRGNQVLNLLIKKSESEDVVDVVAFSFDWIKRLNLLPHFEFVKLKICEAFLKCFAIETEPEFVHAYVDFLSLYMPSEFINDAAIILAKMICERKGFFERLLCDNSKKERNRTFKFLLDVFNQHLKSIRKPQAETMSWSANQEQLLVQWSDELSAVIHVQIVAATMLLLAMDKPSIEVSNSLQAYDELFELWFPENAPKPGAFLVDTTEEAELVQDWVKVRLLGYTCEKIVDSILSTVDDSQIIVFLQTYGLPKENVTKLLSSLDRMTHTNASFLCSIKDRWKTITDFVHSYKILGANGGNEFLHFVEQQKSVSVSPVDENSTVHSEDVSMSEANFVSAKIDSSFKLASFDDLLKTLQDCLVNSSLTVDEYSKHLSGWLAAITFYMSSKECFDQKFRQVLEVVACVKDKHLEAFFEAMNKYDDSICFVWRWLDRFCPVNERNNFIDICSKLCSGLNNNNCSNVLLNQICGNEVQNIEMKQTDKAVVKVLSTSNFGTMSTADSVIHVEHAKIDVLTHRCITELASLAESAYSDVKMERLECTLRRLADKNPELLVRQLPLIAALLRGNTSQSMRKFYNTNCLLYFTMILGLLDSLRPHIFDIQYAPAFMDITDSFFDFIESHGLRNPKLVIIVDKVLALLNDHHAVDPETCTKYLESYALLIQTISIRYPELPNMRILMTRVNLPLPSVAAGSSTTDAQAAGGSDVSELRPVFFRPPSPVQVGHVSQLYDRLKRAENSEEVLSVLASLNELSTSKPDALPFFKVELTRLVCSQNETCCRRSFELLMKLFKQVPREATNFLPTYINCFKNSDDVAKVAITFLPDFCRICSENLGNLLEKVFCWGMKYMGQDAIKYLCEAVGVIHQYDD